MVPRFNHWESVPGNNNYSYPACGRSRSFPAPPQPVIRRQPHSQPCCITVSGFGYVVPNAQFLPRLNSPSPHVPNPPCQLPPLLPLPKIRQIQKKPKVPPQVLILRVVTPSRPITAALKILFLQFTYF